MVSCAVSDCDVTRRNNPNNYTFHRLPSQPALREKWIRVINRHDWTPSKNSTVCSKHFEEKCFIQRKYRRVLFKDSIPTLCVPIKLKQRRLASSYVNRDINLPCEEPAQPAPEPSSTQVLSPRKKKLIDKNARLKIKISEKNKMLKNLKAKTKRMTKRILNLQEVVKELNNRPGLVNHQNEVQVACHNNLLQKLVNRVNGKATGLISHTSEYDEDLKKFALTIHFYSPRSYIYIRDKFDLGLPHVNTLRSWYSRLDCEPGFTKESLNTISELTKCGPVIVAVTFDEIKIREEPEIFGKKHYGYVNVGNDLSGDEIEVAKEILVFMVVAVNGYWKLPVGFFPAKSFTASEKARLLKICLDLLKETNCHVISITFDGIASNLNMAKILGASITTPPYRPYFTYNGRKYMIMFDPCHLIKLIRNCFGDLKVFYDNMGRKIEFRFVEQLQSLQKNEGLHLANKLSSRHVDYKNQKMKVRLATQLLSRSVGIAIDLCDKDLLIPEFRDSDATVQFLHYVNDIFDVFNSRNLNNFGLKKPLCPGNKINIFNKIDEVYEYFQKLKRSTDGTLLINTQRRLGFLGFVNNIIALKWIYVNYVEKHDGLKFLPTYKLSQDHLETFFSAIRSKGGFNNNPTVRQFIAAYKRLLCHTEIKVSESGNCLPLEKIAVLSTSTMSTIDKINTSSNYNKIFKELLQEGDQIILNEDGDSGEDMVLLDNTASLSQMSMMIVSYVSGNVVKRLGKKIRCDVCVQSLTASSSEVFHNALIVKRDYSRTGDGYLTYPSNDVVTLCCNAESYFRQNMKKKRMDDLIYAKNVLNVLRNNQCLFNTLKRHVLDQAPLDDHRYLLMKSIIEMYFDLRLKHDTKSIKFDRETLRTHLNKMVIFRGQ